MNTKLYRQLLSAAIVVVCCVPSLASAQEATNNSMRDQVRGFMMAYLEAFNAGDAQKAASMWAENAQWSDTTTGQSAVGRASVEKDLQAAFERTPGLKLTGSVQQFQQVAPGVICLDGEVAISAPGTEPELTPFTAILVDANGKWQFASVREFAPPATTSPREKLAPLEFLIGEWQDESGDTAVSTSVRWGANETFVVRSYVVDTGDGEPLQGTQVIGWDPLQERIRSWNFDSNGSFGDGLWSQSGGEWVGRLSQTLSDGSTASATQIIRRVDDNTLEVSTVGREVNGEPQAGSDPVRVKRVAPASNAGK